MKGNEIKKYDWVDSLRGYAILLIIMVHTGILFYSKAFHLDGLTKLGDLGVPLFFIISCFTLFNSYKSRAAIDKENTKYFFFIRRLFRIAPLYYLAGLFYIFIAIFYHTRWVTLPLSPLKLLANFTFLNGIFIPAINYLPPGGWSVGDEMLFYLAIPLLFIKINTFKKALFTLAGTIIASFCIQMIMYLLVTRYTHYPWVDVRGWYLYFWLPNQIPVFLFGICLYFFIAENKVNYNEWMLLGSVIILIIMSLFPYNLAFPYFFIQREYIFSLGFCFFAFSLSKTKLLFMIKPMNHIGKLSFSMYLTHFVILENVYKIFNALFDKNNSLNPNVKFVIVYVFTIVATALFSKLTYTYIERQGVKMGENIIERIKQRQLNRNNLA